MGHGIAHCTSQLLAHARCSVRHEVSGASNENRHSTSWTTSKAVIRAHCVHNRDFQRQGAYSGEDCRHGETGRVVSSIAVGAAAQSGNRRAGRRALLIAQHFDTPVPVPCLLAADAGRSEGGRMYSYEYAAGRMKYSCQYAGGTQAGWHRSSYNGVVGGSRRIQRCRRGYNSGVCPL